MSKTKFLSAVLLALTSVLGGCSTEPVVRVVPLEGSPEAIPAGEGDDFEGRLSVTFTAPEPLDVGKRHVLWAETRAEVLALSAIEAGEDQLVDLQGQSIVLEDVREIFVTEEDESTSLPDSPSSSVVVRGSFPGALIFGGVLEEEQFAHASGTARLEDNDMTVTAELPELPPGFHYEVWLDFTEGDEHMHGAAHSHAAHAGPEPSMPEAEADLWFAGLLTSGSIELSTERFLPVAKSVHVTIESDSGEAEHAAASHAMSGVVETGTSASESGHEHMH